MSPLLVRIFILVGMALAAVSLQMKARAEVTAGSEVRVVQAVACPAPWRST